MALAFFPFNIIAIIHYIFACIHPIFQGAIQLIKQCKGWGHLVLILYFMVPYNGSGERWYKDDLYLPYILGRHTILCWIGWSLFYLYLPYILGCHTIYNVYLPLFKHLRVAINEKKSNSKNKNTYFNMFFFVFHESQSQVPSSCFQINGILMVLVLRLVRWHPYGCH